MRKLIITGLALACTAAMGVAAVTHQQAVERAQSSYKAGDYANARASAEEALGVAKTPAEKSVSLEQLGEIYRMEGKYKQARETWAQVLALPTASLDDKAAMELVIGGTYAAERDFVTARKTYARVAAMPQLEPQLKIAVQMALASSYLDEEDFAKAREEFAKVVSNPDAGLMPRVFAQTKIAEAYFSEAKYAQARIEFNAAIKLGDISPVQEATLRARIADSFRAEKNPALANAEIKRFISDIFKKTSAALASRKFPEARELLVAAMAFSPVPSADSSLLRQKIGETFLAEKNTGAAREHFEAVLAVREASVPAQQLSTLRTAQQVSQFALAHSYTIDGNKPRAREEYAKVLKMPGLPPEIKLQVEQQLAKLG